MYVTRRVGSFCGGRSTNGTGSLKKGVWDRKYSRGSCGDGSSTVDFLYALLVEHAHDGSILDLGCGEGKTANELHQGAYPKCVGVDISDGAIAKARAWTPRGGRGGKNIFLRFDFDGFVPVERSTLYFFGIRFIIWRKPRSR